MKLQQKVQESYEAFLKYSEGVQMVLLHSQSNYRSMVVAKLLTEFPKPVLYYAMGPYDVNVISFLSGFAHDLADQHPTFGRHLNQLGIETRGHTKETLLEAMWRDLDEISSDSYLLILDEYDASERANDVQDFLENLLLNLPPQCQVVINSRTLPRLPWVALMAKQQAIILKDNALIIEDPYELEGEGEIATLEVRALGPGEIVKDGNLIEDWEGHLPRLLIIFALERPVITRGEICQAFWPNLESDQAVNVFHVTKRRLHKALGFDALVHENGYYQLNPKVRVNYDTVRFTNALMRGRTTEGQEAVAAWQEAIDLYRGPYLQGHTDAWIEQLRDAYKAGYLSAMMAIANSRLQAKRPEHALRILQQATQENYDFEELHREIMKIYASLGRRSEAAKHYQELLRNLRDQQLEPEVATQELYEELMA